MSLAACSTANHCGSFRLSTMSACARKEVLWQFKLKGVALKRLRQENHMTQRETARLLGCTQARISDMEAGVKPISAEAAQLFAKRFGVSPALFLK